MRKVYFKVVKKNGRTSARSSRRIHNVGLIYSKGTVVRPTLNNSKIFIFGKKSDAIKFMLYNETILRVHAKGVIKAKHIAAYSEDFNGFWTSAESVPPPYSVLPPVGTLLADEVTVLD